MIAKYRVAIIFILFAFASWGVSSALNLGIWSHAVGYLAGVLACCIADITSGVRE